jgi:hypothetical protein
LDYYGRNPDTKKAWTATDLAPGAVDSVKDRIPVAPAASNTPAATTAGGQPGFNAGNVMNLPGMEKYAKKPAPVKTANFGGPSGYGKVTTSFKPMTNIPGMKTTPATTANLPAGGGAGVKAASGFDPKTQAYLKSIQDKQPASLAETKQLERIAKALSKPVTNMLQVVETKEDVQRIKQFVDQTFAKYGTLTESAFGVRNIIVEHVTQVGAQRRREHARKGA